MRLDIPQWWKPFGQNKRRARKGERGVGRAVPIPGGERNADGEPSDKYEMPDEFGEISSEDLDAIKRSTP